MSAREYPFGRARGSFALGGAEVPPGIAEAPLLAYGANASPAALERKLPGVPVAALAGTLRGYAVVHSAHVSGYGAVPATLVPAPGAETAVHALVLPDEDALEALDATEPNYDRVGLARVQLDLDRAGCVDAAQAYISRHGPLLVDGAAVPLGALPQDELRRLVARRAA